jgi:hypothetical protein
MTLARSILKSLPVAATTVLMAVSSAQALTYELLPVPLGITPGTYLGIGLRVDDGISSARIINEQHIQSGGFAEAGVEGIITPVFVVNSLDTRYVEFSQSATFGVNPINVTLTIDPIVVEYTRAGGPLSPTTATVAGQSGSFVPDAVSAAVTGKLDVDGAVTPFDFSLVADCSASECAIRNAFVAAFSPYESFVTRGEVFAQLLNRVPIANVDGVEYSLDLGSNLGNASYALIPEPSTALLLGLGLVGLGATSKRT